MTYPGAHSPTHRASGDGVSSQPCRRALPLFCGALKADATAPQTSIASRPAGDRRRGSWPVTACLMSAAAWKADTQDRRRTRSRTHNPESGVRANEGEKLRASPVLKSATSRSSARPALNPSRYPAWCRMPDRETAGATPTRNSRAVCDARKPLALRRRGHAEGVVA